MNRSRSLSAVSLLLAAAMAFSAGGTHAYPLDGMEWTGITRLEGYRLAMEPLVQAGRLAKGGTFPSDRVTLRMLGNPDFALPAPDAAFSAKVAALLESEKSRYGVVVLDITDPANPKYAAVNPDKIQNPGSVGKVLVALGIFQALADVYPDDLDARRAILKNTQLTANGFIRKDSHVVPFYEIGGDRVRKRPIQEGDTANLWTYLDWMCSSSSNAAAAMLMSQLVLLKHFGTEYPVPVARADAFFADSKKTDLQRIFLDAITTPVTRNGLDLKALRQGSFFTREGKKRVPGTSSHATARELLRFMLKMEQGKLVDPFSSLEIKRLLYLSDRRIRYGSSPALANAAVYFKSGSLYSCKPEEGFTCKKYQGNRLNYLNSVAGVEVYDEQPELHYISVVLSNVLRKNSAVEHQTLATRIHRLVESFHSVGMPPKAEPQISEEELLNAAEGN